MIRAAFLQINRKSNVVLWKDKIILKEKCTGFFFFFNFCPLNHLIPSLTSSFSLFAFTSWNRKWLLTFPKEECMFECYFSDPFWKVFAFLTFWETAWKIKKSERPHLWLKMKLLVLGLLYGIWRVKEAEELGKGALDWISLTRQKLD